MLISVVICTLNRVSDLRLTLESIRSVYVPSGWSVEIVVADNGSTDETQSAVQSTDLGRIAIHYVHEPKGGQATARRTGVAAAQGEIIIFTDDDVRVPPGWISAMTTPIVEGSADALVGGVKLAPHLHRNWMTPTHRSLLATTETINAQAPERMVGANMSFHRRVLESVQFDEELGPGALGFMDDSLFALQLKQGGFRLRSAFETPVEHHLQSDRLARHSWLQRARKQGESQAYVDYHWRHQRVRFAFLKHLWMHLKLFFYRATRYSELRSVEGAPIWEIQMVRGVWYYLQTAKESRRAPKYAYLGLAKMPG
jgi:glycosyltransferase involved in cell wall biosynthesis